MVINYVDILKMVEKQKDILLKPKKNKIITTIMNFFGINIYEASLFSIIFSAMFEKHGYFDFEDIKEQMSPHSKEYSKFLKTANSLEQKNLIVKQDKTRRKSLAFPKYQIDANTFNTLMLNKDESLNVDYNDLFSVVEYYDSIYDKFDNESINETRFYQLIDEISSKLSPEFPFSNILKTITTHEVSLFLYSVKALITGSNRNYVTTFANDTITKLSTRARFIEKILTENSLLLKNKILELTEPGFFKSDPCIEITDSAEKILFSNTSTKNIKKEFKPKYSIYIPYKKLDKTIFLEGSVKKEMEKILSTSSKKNFKKINSQLKKANLPTGLVLLFYGLPGTGKTASVYQLAKKTKRDILQVNISTIKDKYVGESEKRLKGIFTEYYEAVKTLKHHPILLFNEADALISNRISTKTSVDKMNNSMQNILLEEMENFEGIFIATTNLIDNIDNAFSRRFLFKLEFPEPSKQVRKQIWQNKIPELSEKLTDKLSEYQLTGGQIENVARKFTLNKILNLEEFKIENLLNDIEEELNFKQEKTNKIGFWK